MTKYIFFIFFLIMSLAPNSWGSDYIKISNIKDYSNIIFINNDQIRASYICFYLDDFKHPVAYYTNSTNSNILNYRQKTSPGLHQVLVVLLDNNNNILKRYYTSYTQQPSKLPIFFTTFSSIVSGFILFFISFSIKEAWTRNNTYKSLKKEFHSLFALSIKRFLNKWESGILQIPFSADILEYDKSKYNTYILENEDIYNDLETFLILFEKWKRQNTVEHDKIRIEALFQKYAKKSSLFK